MSGPKVVRIVTREEILAICEAHLRRLDQTIAHWAKEGKRTGELSDDEVTATQNRRNALAALISRDAFIELQKGVPDEIAFLKGDLLRRERIAIEKATVVRKRERQGRENAASLLNALAARGTDVPSSLKDELQLIANGGRVEQAESLLAQGFNLLAPSSSQGLSAAQLELANRLKGPDAEQTFEAWKAKQRATSQFNVLLDRVDGQIAEAQEVLGDRQTVMYEQRLRSVESEVNDARKSLLLDSLILDLSGGIEARRAHAAALEQLAELAAQLVAIETDSSASLRDAIARCDASSSLNTLAALDEECRALIDGELQRKAAESRRDVILQGLARLGYDVHEGMTTAWAKDGRVVLRKSSLPGYGVEVGGQAETSRLQVRAVALDENRDVSRDKDVETIWCGEFARLQQLVSENGDNLLIERALGVGQVPLKVVADTSQTRESVTQKRTLN